MASHLQTSMQTALPSKSVCPPRQHKKTGRWLELLGRRKTEMPCERNKYWEARLSGLRKVLSTRQRLHTIARAPKRQSAKRQVEPLTPEKQPIDGKASGLACGFPSLLLPNGRLPKFNNLA